MTSRWTIITHLLPTLLATMSLPRTPKRSWLNSKMLQKKKLWRRIKLNRPTLNYLLIAIAKMKEMSKIW